MESQARLVGGRYEEGEPLGRGGMAEVRKGTDTRLGRVVAIKRLRVDLASDATFQARFRREAQSSAALNHPNIVSVYDTGEEPDPNGSGVTIPYIVMECVVGKTLRDLIREGRKIMPERALEITAGVLEALDYSHRAGIVHRDIKPGNVMLTPQGQVKVMDFGIARAVADTSSTMTQTAAVIGTAQYLSPEQARGETVDARSDLYSTGCLLYELLTGRPPFVGESPVSVAYQHVREHPLPPSSYDPDIPPEVDAVVLKALAKSREERYQSASEMRQDINRVLSGQQVTAPMAAIAETRQLQNGYAPTAATQQFQPAVAGGALLPPDDGQGELEETGNRRNRGLAYFLLGLAIVAVAIGAYALIDNLTGANNANPGGNTTSTAPEKVQVPAVAGKSKPEVTALLQAQGLQLKEGPAQTSDKVAKGLAISQSPEPGIEAERNSVVTVVFSSGRTAYSVPDVIGMSEKKATDTLEDSPGKFKVKDVKEADSEKQKGEVIAIDPDPSGKYPSGAEFTLTVSSGSVKVKVPDVLGMNQDDARNTLIQAGLSVAFAQQSDPSKPDQTVLHQNVKAGNLVEKDTKVTITINNVEQSSPPPSTKPTDDPSGDPSNSNTPPTLTLPTNPEGEGEQ